jgi:hypothetical protein
LNAEASDTTLAVLVRRGFIEAREVENSHALAFALGAVIEELLGL